MNYNDKIESMKDLFNSYAETFITGNEKHDKNIELKHFHSLEVLQFANEITDSLALDVETSFIARAAALGHDIGRFEQYKKYNTYNDALSENHGALSEKIMHSSGFLDGIGPEASKIISLAVLHHNAMEIPDDIGKKEKFITQIVRDADKLDIYRVVINRYTSPDPDTRHSIILGLKDTEYIADWVMDSVRERKKIPMKKLSTVSEFKMLQVGWVYDLNFPYSVRKIREKNYIPKILSTIPEKIRSSAVESHVMDYINSF